MKIPPGLGLMLAGSGLYWVLAGPLIGWFSVFNPLQIRLSQLGLTLILVVGILTLFLGLWIIPVDLWEAQTLFSRGDGWIFTIPIMLTVADIYLTLLGLSRGGWELNPYVSSAVQIGPWAVIPFVASYVALSEGLALLMLFIGKSLLGSTGPVRFMPFALVCGAASFGPLNNTILLASPLFASLNFAFGALGMVGVSLGVFKHFRKVTSFQN